MPKAPRTEADDHATAGPRLSIAPILPETPLQDAPGEGAPVESWAVETTSDWASLLADLSRAAEPTTLRVHDRTHLEILIDYDLRPSQAVESFVWEAYFFAPESLRLSQRTYDKQDLYSDLQSYVRFAVPDVRFADLIERPLGLVRAAVASRDPATVLRELRILACQVRAAGVEARRAILNALDGQEGESEGRRAQALIAAERMTRNVREFATALRTVLGEARMLPDPVHTAAEWIDEDVSRILETLMANLAIGLRTKGLGGPSADAAEQAAVDEARHRIATKLDGVGRLSMKPREVEHLEFRRHVLKRFTSSVLWLEPEVRPASAWVLHTLYALAASVAMAFATLAALWTSTNTNPGDFYSRGFFQWAVVVILGYAAKDRIKALLQTTFQNVVSRHFPDRSWRILDAAKKATFATMEEQSGFQAFSDLPKDVLEVRRATRIAELEEEARPETVLFHRKEVELDCGAIRKADGRFDAITEIYRLDLRRWLAHTDDPRRDFVFADPDKGVVATASAPRVYNIGVVYRLKRANDPSPTPWHRVRIVVNRKGIRRIERIL